MLLRSIETLSRRKFDPTSTADLEVYRQFRANRGWGKDGCPFIIEWPFLTVESMVVDKIMNAHIKTLIDKTSSK